MKSLTETIEGRLEFVRKRIESACARVGRSPEEITLIAVTKTYPPDVVRAGLAAGLMDFGENRVQELVAKTDALPGEVQGGTIRWHLIGPLQRNKAKLAAQLADNFHSLDSLRLAETLNRHAGELQRNIPCMVQVNVSGEETKSGVSPQELPQLLEELSPFENLTVRGLMTLAAPANSDSELESVVRPQLRLLRELAEANTAIFEGVGSPDLSMGMSGDFEVAIEEGATHIRLGSVLFGPRQY